MAFIILIILINGIVSCRNSVKLETSTTNSNEWEKSASSIFTLLNLQWKSQNFGLAHQKFCQFKHNFFFSFTNLSLIRLANKSKQHSIHMLTCSKLSLSSLFCWRFIRIAHIQCHIIGEHIGMYMHYVCTRVFQTWSQIINAYLRWTAKIPPLMLHVYIYIRFHTRDHRQLYYCYMKEDKIRRYEKKR